MIPARAAWPVLVVACVLVASDGGALVRPPRAHPVALGGEFSVLALCMGSMEPARQVAFLEGVGFRSMGVPDLDSSKLRAFRDVPEVASGRFRILSGLWWADVDAPFDTVRFVQALGEARKLDAAAWLVLDGHDKSTASKTKALAVAATAARLCRANGVRLVLYPHGGCVVSTAEEGLDLLESLRRQGWLDVGLSIHLCHELLAGNAGRLSGIVARAAPFLVLASVSGSEVRPVVRGDSWWPAIKPLDEGEYEPALFLEALSKAGYRGPVLLHTYGLPTPDAPGYDHHLERSVAWWRGNVTIHP